MTLAHVRVQRSLLYRKMQFTKAWKILIFVFIEIFFTSMMSLKLLKVYIAKPFLRLMSSLVSKSEPKYLHFFPFFLSVPFDDVLFRFPIVDIEISFLQSCWYCFLHFCAFHSVSCCPSYIICILLVNANSAIWSCSCSGRRSSFVAVWSCFVVFLILVHSAVLYGPC